jgi:ABC-type transporter Mla subunit MlaD
MRRLLAAAVILAAVAFPVISAATTGEPSATGTYKIQFDNAFGLVSGADFKVAGVPAGTIQSVGLPSACKAGQTRDCYAQVTVKVTQDGFGAFHEDAFCESRPQSLIGEYFIDCQPGHRGETLPPGSTIPVTHTRSTIPADLLQNILRLPYRERAALIINELGAGVAARSDDLEAALRRAVPALTETDDLLNILAGDSKTLQQLTASANRVVGALAGNRIQVTRFVTEADRTATVVAGQQANLRASLALLPGFLAQLRPAMAELGAASSVSERVFQNLNGSAAQLARLFEQVPAFSRSALPALKSLGQASLAGRAAVDAAAPTVQDLQAFARPTPELAQNLAIVLHDLDDRGRAVEPDPRSPQGKGYTGLEALLQYVFNQTLAINTFGPFGHLLAVDSFVDPACSPYATPATIALSLAQFGPSYRRCYAWLGPSQPGVNETDPSNPGACVPDPGGAPPGERGPRTTACRLTAAAVASAARRRAAPAPVARIARKRPQHVRKRAAHPAPSAAPTGTAVSASPANAPSSGTSSGPGPAGELLNYLLAP